LSVAAVARRLGIAPATLRTWDRRYGLGPTDHASGAHRRYSPADVARLERMRRLLLEGVGTADAARQASAEPPTSPPSVSPPPADGADPASAGRGLARAAQAMDEDGVRRLARAALSEHGVVAGWHSVLCPVLQAAGERWAKTGEGVEVEHLLAEALGSELRTLLPSGASAGGVDVLLACPDGDYHSLPLQALAVVLAEHGVTSRMLGGSLPSGALTAAVTRTGPGALVLYAQLPVTDPSAVLAAVPVTRPPVSVVVGGPGWNGARLPRARHVNGLAEAAEAVLEGLGRAR
jgi:DNA-binding transcriptional MerR regulator